MNIKEKVEAVLKIGDHGTIAREIPSIIDAENQAKESIEQILVSHLLDTQPPMRMSAAIGLYAMTHAHMGGATIEDNIQRASIRPESLEALVAAVLVETNFKIKFEQLWALSVQSFKGELAKYAGLLGRIIEATLSSNSPAPQEMLERLNYAYEKLKRERPDLLLRKQAEIKKRELIGYAATGIPFILTDRKNPEVVLVYNYNLEAWLPPGGHFEPGEGEVPDDILVKKIAEETGANCKAVWEARSFDSPLDDTISVLPTPSFVLFEDLRAMKNGSPEIHTHHYDLNYICQVTSDSIDKIGQGKLRAIRVPLGQVLKAKANEYKQIIQKSILEQAKPTGMAHTVPDNVVERILISLGILREHLMPGKRERIGGLLAEVFVSDSSKLKLQGNLWTTEGLSPPGQNRAPDLKSILERKPVLAKAC